MVTDERVNGWYLAVFFPLMIVGTVAAAFGAVTEADGWLPTLLVFFRLEAPVAVGSTGLAFSGVQLGGLIVFWLETALKKRDEERQKLRAAALAEGREQGRTEAYAAIAAWDARRRAAEAQGNEFNEPPPYGNSAAS